MSQYFWTEYSQETFFSSCGKLSKLSNKHGFSLLFLRKCRSTILLQTCRHRIPENLFTFFYFEDLKKKKIFDKESIGEVDENIFILENNTDISLSIEYSET